ncbi:hypothetical protein [Pseudonocardia sp. MH-G8]|uniref:hypothetical protein n=1 Tax=Pseudonocardia sp. MH-G8 TaxID=1854588 RepID=UPI00117A3097|nr:hypothetical protein [Pseudonocardia sp. MH-G8]
MPLDRDEPVSRILLLAGPGRVPQTGDGSPNPSAPSLARGSSLPETCEAADTTSTREIETPRRPFTIANQILTSSPGNRNHRGLRNKDSHPIMSTLSLSSATIESLQEEIGVPRTSLTRALNRVAAVVSMALVALILASGTASAAVTHQQPPQPNSSEVSIASAGDATAATVDHLTQTGWELWSVFVDVGACEEAGRIGFENSVWSGWECQPAPVGAYLYVFRVI